MTRPLLALMAASIAVASLSPTSPATAAPTPLAIKPTITINTCDYAHLYAGVTVINNGTTPSYTLVGAPFKISIKAPFPNSGPTAAPLTGSLTIPAIPANGAVTFSIPVNVDPTTPLQSTASILNVAGSLVETVPVTTTQICLSPTPSPSPTATPTPSPSPTLTPTPTPSPAPPQSYGKVFVAKPDGPIIKVPYGVVSTLFSSPRNVHFTNDYRECSTHSRAAFAQDCLPLMQYAGVALVWDFDTTDYSVDGYRVYRVDGATPALVGTQTDPQWTDRYLGSGIQGRCFDVVAYKGSKEYLPSAKVCAP